MPSCSCHCAQVCEQIPYACHDETALPLTMELADLLKVRVSSPRGWHRNDRLVAALHPESAFRVRKFYKDHRHTVEYYYDTPETLEMYDLFLLSRLLEWVGVEYPETYAALTA